MVPTVCKISCHCIQVLIIEGETGSGKTTQIPQYLFEAVCSFKSVVLYLDHANVKWSVEINPVFPSLVADNSRQGDHILCAMRA